MQVYKTITLVEYIPVLLYYWAESQEVKKIEMSSIQQYHIFLNVFLVQSLLVVSTSTIRAAFNQSTIYCIRDLNVYI